MWSRRKTPPTSLPPSPKKGPGQEQNVYDKSSYNNRRGQCEKIVNSKRVSEGWESQAAWPPDRPFCNLRSSKSADRRFRTTNSKPIVGFWGWRFVKGSVVQLILTLYFCLPLDLFLCLFLLSFSLIIYTVNTYFINVSVYVQNKEKVLYSVQMKMWTSFVCIVILLDFGLLRPVAKKNATWVA